MNDLRPSARAPLLLLGFIALVAGTAGGLVRLGLPVPAPAGGIAWHGVLFVAAFFGTLISLERAVALGRMWAYAAPAACGAGGIVLLFGGTWAAFWLLFAGSVVLAAASLAVYRREPVLHLGVLALGALSLAAANLLPAQGFAVEAALPGWLAFFALTIGGERLELSRLAPVPPLARRAFGALAVATFVAALAAYVAPSAALRAIGTLLAAMALWLGRYDIAWRTVRGRKLTRYMALCLLSGYAWLALGGVAFAWAGFAAERELYDAALHALFVGFVFSMVFGHAPVILPAVVRIAMPYSAWLYLPLALLHGSLALRIAGDWAASGALRAAGAAGNALAIVAFIAAAAVLALGARRRVR
jgi:hypothetical protein